MRFLACFLILVCSTFCAAFEQVVSFQSTKAVSLGAHVIKVSATVDGSDIPEALARALVDLSNYTYEPGWQGGEIKAGTNLVLHSLREEARVGQIVVLAFEAVATEKGVGKLTFRAPDGWKSEYEGSPGIEITTLIPDRPSRFKGKLDLGFTIKNGFAAGLSGSGLIHDSLSQKVSLSVDGLVPLYSPKLPGSDDRRSTSEDVDLLSLSLDSVRYSRGGSLTKFGLKARMPSGGQGGEVVAYLGLLSLGYQSSKRGNGIASYTFASEVEVGNRWGDVEWTNLSSAPKSTGSTVARLGVLGEFWPRLGVVNERIGQGLCVYVRGRFWLDHAEVNKKRVTRGRGFVDAELFYVLPTSDYRVFVRYEGGMLPPNLSTYTNRVFAGMGAKF